MPGTNGLVEKMAGYTRTIDLAHYTGRGYRHERVDVEIPEGLGVTVDGVVTHIFERLKDKGTDWQGFPLGNHPYILVKHSDGNYVVVGPSPRPDLADYNPVELVAVIVPDKERRNLVHVTPVSYDAIRKVVSKEQDMYRFQPPTQPQKVMW